MERTGKISRTAKFEICSIGIYNLVAVQISEILRLVWEKVAVGQALPLLAFTKSHVLI